ncbi:MAG TPA: hypothetical protein VGC19_15425 [Rhodanobacter sp.]
MGSIPIRSTTHSSNTEKTGNRSESNGPVFLFRAAAPSKSEEVRRSHKHDADDNEQCGAGHEIRKHHQRQSAYQRHDRSLLFSVHEKAEPNRSEQDAPE